jgi:HlyD family secretion protein
MLQFAGPAVAWQGLAPGFRLWGRVYLRRSPASVLCPVGALVRDRGGWAAYRLVGARARLRAVRVGAMDDQNAEVLTGLRPGARVVIYPSDQVRDGVRVQPRG